MEPTRGDFDYDEVDGIDQLRQRWVEAETAADWSYILSDHIGWGNTKVHKNTAIFNMNSATDCPNARTQEDGESETGLCQVPWKDCYAHQAEDPSLPGQYSPDGLDARRRQQILWEYMDADTFVNAFREILGRKWKYVSERSDANLRLSEAGDFRHNGDIRKAEQIAKQLATDGVDVYTYSASYKLDWSIADELTVNESVSDEDYGNRDFDVETVDSIVERARDAGEDVPHDPSAEQLADAMTALEETICPFSLQSYGGNTDDRTKCGECQACIDEDVGDIVVLPH